MRKYTLLFIFGLLVMDLSFSQNVNVFINSERITTDQALTLTVEIKGARGGRAPRFPNVTGFGNGGVRTMSQNINGKSSLLFSQTYVPQKTGKFTIPSFSFNHNNQSYQSPSFKVEVVKGTGRKKQQTQRRNPLDDFFSDPFFRDPFGSRRKDPKQLTFEEVNADFFLSVNLNKDECYIGEQILGEIIMYINERDHGKIQLAATAVRDMQQRLKNKAFWEEIIEFQENPWNKVTINGKRYIAYTLYRTVLFPIKTGDIEFKNVWLDAKKLHVATNASPFDRFYMNTTKFEPIKIYAPKQILKVKPLPETDLPNAHSVGKFKVKAKLSSKKVNTGDPVTLNVNIKGNGNINLLPKPEVSFDPSLDVYDPVSTFATHKSQTGLYGDKDIEYTVVPTHGGDFNLGPVKFYYFNPSEEHYDSIIVPNLPLHVEGEDLDNLVLRSSSLDQFYTNALEGASNTVPFRIPGKGIFLIAGIGLLFGAIGFKVVKNKKSEEA